MTFIKRYAVAIYFALTFVITWGSMALIAGPGGFPMSPELVETLGPMVYMGMLVGPTAAGLLMIGLTDGRAGYRDLLKRLVKGRVGGRWYAVALLTAPVLITVILLILSIWNAEFFPVLFVTDNALGLVLSSLAMGIFVGLFEELGWTGFAIPKMRERYNVLATGVILGLIWGLWHFPPFWEADTFVGTLPFILLLARLFTWLPAYRILMVWVYDHTESLLVIVLMHASLVASLSIFVPATISGGVVLTWILSWAVGLWVVIAAIGALRPDALRRSGGLTIKEA